MALKKCCLLPPYTTLFIYLSPLSGCQQANNKYPIFKYGSNSSAGDIWYDCLSYSELTYDLWPEMSRLLSVAFTRNHRLDYCDIKHFFCTCIYVGGSRVYAIWIRLNIFWHVNGGGGDRYKYCFGYTIYIFVYVEPQTHVEYLQFAW